MADLIGSESSYANSRTGKATNKAQSASPQTSPQGSSVVTPPISMPGQNIATPASFWKKLLMMQGRR